MESGSFVPFTKGVVPIVRLLNCFGGGSPCQDYYETDKVIIASGKVAPTTGLEPVTP